MENALNRSNEDASNRMDMSVTALQRLHRMGAQNTFSHNADAGSLSTTQKTIFSGTSRLSRSSRKKNFISPAPPFHNATALNPSNQSKIPGKPSDTSNVSSAAPIRTEISNPTPEPEITPFANFSTPVVTISPPTKPPTPTSAHSAPRSCSQEEEPYSFNSADSAKRRLVLEPEGENPPPDEKRFKELKELDEESFGLQISQRSTRRLVRHSQQRHPDPLSEPLLSVNQVARQVPGANLLESITLPSSDEDEMNPVAADMPTCDRQRIVAWLYGNRSPSPIRLEEIKSELVDENISDQLTQPWLSPNRTVSQNETNEILGGEIGVVFRSPVSTPVKIVKEIDRNALASQTRSPRSPGAAKRGIGKGQTTLDSFMIRREVVEVRTEGVQTNSTGSDIERLQNEVQEARTKAAAAQKDWALLMGKMKAKTPDLRAISKPKEEETRPVTICPFYKKIGTDFAVDAFSYGNILGVTHYFLTHFHSDHYRGLRVSISKPVVCSLITANLVKANFRLKDAQLFVMELNQPVVINDVEVTAVDANHCPGAVMFLFRFPGGKTVLHVGDFRFHSRMKECPILNRHSLDEIYLDTTFCAEQYDFPKQHLVLSKAVNLTMEFCNDYKRPLIVCGTYSIGKEKVFKAIAQALNWKIWVVPNKTKFLQCIGDAEILSRVTKNKMEANVHVVELREINQRKLAQYFETLEGNFDGILGFKPTGWEYEKNTRLNDLRPKRYGQISVVGLPYSEHSSFSELKEFIQHFAPRKIIPTVNVGSVAARLKMEKLFDAWKDSCTL